VNSYQGISSNPNTSPYPNLFKKSRSLNGTAVENVCNYGSLKEREISALCNVVNIVAFT